MVTIQDNSSILIYRVGPVFCCAPCLSVISITHPAPLTKLPGQKSRHSGIFKFNANLVNVCELRTNFGVAPEMWVDPGRVIITNLTSGYVGFWVDEIIDVMAFPNDGWGNPPPLIPRATFTKTLSLNNEIHLYADFKNLNAIKQTGYLKSYIAHLEKIKSATIKTTASTESNKPTKTNHKKETLPVTSFNKSSVKKTKELISKNITKNNIETTSSDTAKSVNSNHKNETRPVTPADKPDFKKTTKVISKNNIQAISSNATKKIRTTITPNTKNNKLAKKNTKKENLPVTSLDKFHVKKINKVISSNTMKTSNKIKLNSPKKNTQNKTTKPKNFPSTQLTKNKITINSKKAQNNPINPNVPSHNANTPQSFSGLLLGLILFIPILIAGYYFISYQQKTTQVKLTLADQTITAETTQEAMTTAVSESSHTSKSEITEPKTTTPDDATIFTTEEMNTINANSVTQTTTNFESTSIEKITEVKKVLIIPDKNLDTVAKHYLPNIELGIKNKHTADITEDSKGITIKLYTPVIDKPKALDPAKITPNKTKANSIKNQNKVIKKLKKTINKKQTKLAPSIISKEIIHIVVKGDTLWHIAKFYVDDPYRYPELARLSNIKNPDLIYPGDRVHIIQIFTK